MTGLDSFGCEVPRYAYMKINIGDNTVENEYFDPIMGHCMMVCAHSIVDSIVFYDSTRQGGGVWL